MERPGPGRYAVIFTIFAMAVVANVTHFVRSLHFIHTPRPSQPPLPLRYWHKRWFNLVIVKPIVDIVMQATFAGLSWSHGGDWPMWLLVAVLVSSILRECLLKGGSWAEPMRSFNPRVIFPIGLAVSLVCVVGSLVGSLVGGVGSPANKRARIGEWVAVTTVVLLYRSWIVFEWIRVAQDTAQNKSSIAVTVMICVLATVASGMGATCGSLLDRLLIISGTHVIYDILEDTRRLFYWYLARWSSRIASDFQGWDSWVAIPLPDQPSLRGGFEDRREE